MNHQAILNIVQNFMERTFGYKCTGYIETTGDFCFDIVVENVKMVMFINASKVANKDDQTIIEYLLDRANDFTKIITPKIEHEKLKEQIEERNKKIEERNKKIQELTKELNTLKDNVRFHYNMTHAKDIKL